MPVFDWTRTELARLRPRDLAQAGRIPGVSPADLAVLSVAVAAAARAAMPQEQKEERP